MTPTAIIIFVVFVCIINFIIYKASSKPEPYFERLAEFFIFFSLMQGIFLADDVKQFGMDLRARGDVFLSDLGEDFFTRIELQATTALWFLGIGVAFSVFGLFTKYMPRIVKRFSSPGDDQSV